MKNKDFSISAALEGIRYSDRLDLGFIYKDILRNPDSKKGRVVLVL